MDVKEVTHIRTSMGLGVLAVLIVSIVTCAVTVTDVYNAPNPLYTQTTFYLVYYPTSYDFHSVVTKIYNLGMQQVAQPFAEDSDCVTWAGVDFDEITLANGTYIYKTYVYELD